MPTRGEGRWGCRLHVLSEVLSGATPEEPRAPSSSRRPKTVVGCKKTKMKPDLRERRERLVVQLEVKTASGPPTERLGGRRRSPSAEAPSTAAEPAPETRTFPLEPLCSRRRRPTTGGHGPRGGLFERGRDLCANGESRESRSASRTLSLPLPALAAPARPAGARPRRRRRQGRNAAPGPAGPAARAAHGRVMRNRVARDTPPRHAMIQR